MVSAIEHHTLESCASLSIAINIGNGERENPIGISNQAFYDTAGITHWLDVALFRFGVVSREIHYLFLVTGSLVLFRLN